MKSIQRNFKKAQGEEPNLGEYPALVRAVQGKQYTRRTIRKNLYLLDDSDMDERMKKQLTEHLYGESHKVVHEDQNDIKILTSELLAMSSTQYST